MEAILYLWCKKLHNFYYFFQITTLLGAIGTASLDNNYPIAECTAEIFKETFSPGSTIFFAFMEPYKEKPNFDYLSCPLQVKDILHPIAYTYFPQAKPGVRRFNSTIKRCYTKTVIRQKDLIYMPDPQSHEEVIEHRIKWGLCTIFRGGQFSEQENYVLKQLHLEKRWKLTVGDLSSPLLNNGIDGGYLIMLKYNSDVDSLINYLGTQRPRLQYIAYRNTKVVIVILGTSADIILVNKLLSFFYNVVEFSDVIMIAKGIENEIYVYTSVRDNCGRFKEVSALKKWVNGQFVKNFNLQQHETNFKGCEIVIIANENPPFVIFNDDTERVDGLEGRLLDHITKHLGLIPRFNSFKENETQEIYIGINHMFNYKYLPYIERYYTLQYEWFIPRAKAYPRWSSITRVFSGTVWISTILSSILISITLCCIQNAYQKLSGTPCTMGYFMNIWAISLGISIKLPTNTALRMIFLTWIIFSIAFSTIFQAFMTSFFTDAGRQHQINTYDELMQSNLTFVFDSLLLLARHRYLTNRGGYVTFHGTIDSLLFWAQNPNVAVMIGKDFFIYNLPRICTSVKFHKIRGYAVEREVKFMIRKSSPFLFRINQLTKRLLEGGIPSKIMNTIINPKGLKVGNKGNRILDVYKPISTWHVICSFVFLGIGYLVSLIVFAVEVSMSKLFKIS
ncbi:Ionotropic receptor 770 [Blattella germanica]|nr:Ionotropic receptor 770 [Blattella germanica]